MSLGHQSPRADSPDKGQGTLDDLPLPTYLSYLSDAAPKLIACPAINVQAQVQVPETSWAKAITMGSAPSSVSNKLNNLNVCPRRLFGPSGGVLVRHSASRQRWRTLSLASRDALATMPIREMTAA